MVGWFSTHHFSNLKLGLIQVSSFLCKITTYSSGIYFIIHETMRTGCHTFIGPRHTPNPSTLRKIWVQKITHKKLLRFSEKFYWEFKSILTYLRNTLEDIIHGKYVNILNNKTWKVFDLRKYAFFGHFPIFSNLIHSKTFWCWPKYYR